MEVVVRGMGYVLHAVDPVADSPLAPDLWKMTEEDAKAIAEPLSRIWNRYDTLRGAAGFSDEIGVAGAAAPYVKRNLAERGRVKAAHDRQEQESPHAARYQPEPLRQPETPAAERTRQPDGQPQSQPVRQPGDEPEVLLADTAGSEDDLLRASKQGVADTFEFQAGPHVTSQPPHETDRGD
jgi:hypothetical protein